MGHGGVTDNVSAHISEVVGMLDPRETHYESKGLKSIIDK